MEGYGNQHHHHQRPQYVEEEYEKCVFAPTSGGYRDGYERSEPYQMGHNNYQCNERMGELGALAFGAFALNEGNKANSDPIHAAKHKHEAEAAALGALGSGGYAYYEHRKKDVYKEQPY
ncbi:hypothetical protein L7F22_054440 [Adiantum nelumboides]|nr:hypothetical protein [Adiantum nelumboides]